MEPAGDLFKRIPLPVDEPSADEGAAYWIAKAQALPRHWKLAHGPLVWVAGLETWKTLARRGIWVNGSAESLGEAEDPGIDTLAGERPSWVKLTHDRGAKGGARRVVATYRLEPRDTFPDLTGKTHFFWSSGSLFLRALEVHPWIRDAEHASGPGHTHATLGEALGAEDRPRVFLNREAWLRHYTEKTS